MGLLRDIRAWLFRWERDEQGRRRPGTWSQSYSGSMCWPLDPLPEEIHFDDICAGLRELRYRAQTREPYTVLEHSVLVSCEAEKLARERGYSEEVAKACARYGLLHDASEAYIGDVTRPLKRQRVMRGYCKLERKWDKAIRSRFNIFDCNIYETMLAMVLVHEADTRITLDEIEALMVDPNMWDRMGRYVDVKPLGVEIPGWTWKQATSAFCQRFSELWTDWPEVTFAKDYARKFYVV